MIERALRAADPVMRRDDTPSLLSPGLFALLLAGVMLRVNLSANMLAFAGIPYAQDGGNPLIKIHPGTWLVLLALVADFARAMLRGRNWLRGRQGSQVFFLAMIALCILHSLLSTGLSGVAVYVDSYLCAGLVAVLAQDANPKQRRILAAFLLGSLLVNAAIALAETTLHENLFPDMSDVIEKLQEYPEEFRGIALFDHPLSGAMATMIGMFLVLGMTMRRGLQVLLLGVLGLGLFAFGGRAALAVTFATLGSFAALDVLRRVAARRFGLTMALATLAVGLLVPLAAWVVMTHTPFGERILTHLTLDDSASARGVQWRALTLLNARQAMLGATIEQVRQIEFVIGQDTSFTDVEDFWLASFLSLGVVGFSFFLAGMLPFLLGLWRQAPFWGRTMLVCGMVVASSSNTLARKSDLLVLLVIAVFGTTGFTRDDEVAAQGGATWGGVMPRALRPAMLQGSGA